MDPPPFLPSYPRAVTVVRCQATRTHSARLPCRPTVPCIALSKARPRRTAVHAVLTARARPAAGFGPRDPPHMCGRGSSLHRPSATLMGAPLRHLYAPCTACVLCVLTSSPRVRASHKLRTPRGLCPPQFRARRACGPLRGPRTRRALCRAAEALRLPLPHSPAARAHTYTPHVLRLASGPAAPPLPIANPYIYTPPPSPRQVTGHRATLRPSLTGSAVTDTRNTRPTTLPTAPS